MNNHRSHNLGMSTDSDRLLAWKPSLISSEANLKVSAPAGQFDDASWGFADPEDASSGASPGQCDNVSPKNGDAPQDEGGHTTIADHNGEASTATTTTTTSSHPPLPKHIFSLAASDPHHLAAAKHLDHQHTETRVAHHPASTTLKKCFCKMNNCNNNTSSPVAPFNVALEENSTKTSKPELHGVSASSIVAEAVEKTIWQSSSGVDCPKTGEVLPPATETKTPTTQDHKRNETNTRTTQQHWKSDKKEDEDDDVIEVWDAPKKKRGGCCAKPRVVQEPQKQSGPKEKAGALSRIVEAVQSKLSSLRVEDLPSSIKPIAKSEKVLRARSRGSTFVGVSRSGLLWKSAIQWKGVTHCLGFHESEWKAGAMYAWAISIVDEFHVAAQTHILPAEKEASSYVTDESISTSDMQKLLQGLKTNNIPSTFSPFLRKEKCSHQERPNAGIFAGTRRKGQKWSSVISVNGIEYEIGTFESDWAAGSAFAWAHYSLLALQGMKKLQPQIRHSPTHIGLLLPKPQPRPSTVQDAEQKMSGQGPVLQPRSATTLLRQRASRSSQEQPNAAAANTIQHSTETQAPSWENIRKQPVTPLVAELARQYTHYIGQVQPRKRSLVCGEDSRMSIPEKKTKVANVSNVPATQRRKLPVLRPNAQAKLRSLIHPSPLILPIHGVPSSLPTHVFVEKDSSRKYPVRLDNITDRDVRLGRGSNACNSPGNAWYRRLISHYRKPYAAMPNDSKRLLTHNLITFIRLQGGRFLESFTSSVFYEVGDTRAYKKTSQALREGAPALRSAIQQAEDSIEAARTNAVNSERNKTNTTTATTATPQDKDTKGEEPKEEEPIEQTVNLSGSFVF